MLHLSVVVYLYTQMCYWLYKNLFRLYKSVSLLIITLVHNKLCAGWLINRITEWYANKKKYKFTMFAFAIFYGQH